MLFPSSYVLDFRSYSLIDELTLALEEIRTVKYDENCFDERENIYLSECAYGITLKEICTNMNLSERTVRRIQEKLLNKTGLVSSKQLVAFAISRKIIKTRRGEALLGKE